MILQGKKVLVLGGSGLVGLALCKEMLSDNPAEILVLSLTKSDSYNAVAELRKEIHRRKNIGQKHLNTKLLPLWGNIFLRSELQGKEWKEILEKRQYRQMCIRDILDELSTGLLSNFWIHKIIVGHKPHIIVDCVNTATAISYKDKYDVYAISQEVRENLDHLESLPVSVEKLLCSLYIPQLIRHVQILYKAMEKAQTKIYVKIGTSGTGGMGLNIPYTHSEESPSRVLLSKSSVAGAQTLLLYLMGRTPGGPITKEIKPTAAIAWKKIGYGEIGVGQRRIPLYDCPPQKAAILGKRIKLEDSRFGIPLDNKNLKSVFIDTGENGVFSREEFAAITTTGQMEFVTPEEISRNVIEEIKGGNTGTDVINALNNTSMGPTYRAGFLRVNALRKMKELEERYKTESIAFEMLGPPRLSKLLYEAYLLKREFKTMQNVMDTDPDTLSRKLYQLVCRDKNLRSEIISIGIPILLPDGRRLLRAALIKTPHSRGGDEVGLDRDKKEAFAHDGWVDLRVKNMENWQRRFKKIIQEVSLLPKTDTSSRWVRDEYFWHNGAKREWEINVGEVVGWIFNTEEKGERGKE